MSSEKLTDIYVVSEELLPTPREIKQQLPCSEKAAATVLSGRAGIRNILNREDPRRFLIVGPCSIHDLAAAKEYGQRLCALAKEVEDQFLLVMRVYFTKPRTTVGWKGFINDPNLNDSFHISEGLYKAREFLVELGEIGIPVGTEALDSTTPQYLDDLLAWSAIGARTAESQTHREMASGLSTPVGIKNGTDGNVDVAINALQTMSHSHAFLGTNQNGQCCVLTTSGNPYGHMILRGGSRPNYDSVHVALAEQSLKAAKLNPAIVVDCSHGNSLKNYELQPVVFRDCIHQIVEGNTSIVGLMLESNLVAGRQDIPEDRSKLQYGVSITDSCIDWDTTETLIRWGAEKIAE